MQPEQDPTKASNCSPILLRRQQYIEYLEKKQSIIQRRDQRTTNLLSLVTTPRPTPGNASWNLTSDMSESPSPTDSTVSTASVWTGTLRNGSMNSHHHRYSQFQEDQRSTSNNVDDHSGVSLPDLDDTTTSEFVKKLYRMLTEPTFQSFVCWGPQGDTFIVKNMHECTEFVLPRLFKHTNFSSFIRQLNKYGFRKVNPTQGAQYGVHSWTFQHPHFREGHPEAFERVVRKPSIPRRAPITSRSPRPHSVAQFTPTAQLTTTSPGWHNLDARLTTLERNHADMHAALNNCELFLHHLVSRFCQNPKGTDRIEGDLDLSHSNPGSDINIQHYPSALGLARPQPGLNPDRTLAPSPYNPQLPQTPFGSSNLLSIPSPQSPSDSTSSTLRSNFNQIHPHRHYPADIWGSSSSESQTPFAEFDDNKYLFG